MRLIKQSGAGWKYELNRNEGILLRTLVKEFPLTAATAARISRTGSDAKSAERERLLNESLARHRQELKHLAGKLLAVRLKHEREGWRLSLSESEREVLLQLLNDIRVESWHALGEPAELDMLPVHPSGTDLRHHHLMQLAGFFEYKMVNLESGR